jgi:hypothetical protein
MTEEPPRLLRHRKSELVFELDQDGNLGSMPSDAEALDEFLRAIRHEASWFDEQEQGDHSGFLLIDSPDHAPIAYSPPHRFGRFWIVPRLWLRRQGRAWYLLSP